MYVWNKSVNMSAHSWGTDAPVRMSRYGTITAIANVLELTVWQLAIQLVYLNGNNAAEGENNIKYANSYPMNWTVKNWFAQDIFESLW